MVSILVWSTVWAFGIVGIIAAFCGADHFFNDRKGNNKILGTVLGFIAVLILLVYGSIGIKYLTHKPTCDRSERSDPHYYHCKVR
jgi:hypothetical protein